MATKPVYHHMETEDLILCLKTAGWVLLQTDRNDRDQSELEEVLTYLNSQTNQYRRASVTLTFGPYWIKLVAVDVVWN